MLSLHPEYIIDISQRKKAVIIPYNEWEKILDDMEELEDIRAYDKAKKSDSDPISFSEALSEIKKVQ